MGYDENEREEQAYQCQNIGCTSEGIFMAAPEAWWEARSLTTPKNCPECREWIDDEKTIGPISAVCHFCQFTWGIEATYRIIYHKKVGNWDVYWEENETLQICRRCTENPGRRRQLDYRKAEKKYREHPEESNKVVVMKKIRQEQERVAQGKNLWSLLNSHRIEGAPSSYQVPDSMMFYASIKTPKHLVHEHGETQLTHILKTDHEWKQQLGTEDPHRILSLAASIAKSTEDHVLEFKDQKSGMIIKYDTTQQVTVVISQSGRSGTGYKIHTTFKKPLKGVLTALEEKKWK